MRSQQKNLLRMQQAYEIETNHLFFDELPCKLSFNPAEV